MIRFFHFIQVDYLYHEAKTKVVSPPAHTRQ